MSNLILFCNENINALARNRFSKKVVFTRLQVLYEGEDTKPGVAFTLGIFHDS